MTYLTAGQLEERANAKLREAEQLPPGEARRHAFNNATQLRSFAAMKRQLALDRPEVAAE
jgi:hypothetical protein